MRKIIWTILLLVGVSACSAPPTAAPTSTNVPASTATSAPPTAAPTSTNVPVSTATSAPPTAAPTSTNVPASTATSAPQPTPTNSRSANIKEIINKVDARGAQSQNFSDAALGQVLNIGGQARTRENSKARLDFTEGTIVRLGESTVLTVEELASADGSPFTRFQMELGKLWITLRGGKMDIKTPAGIVSVRGSHYIVEIVNGETFVIVITGLGSAGGMTAMPRQGLEIMRNGMVSRFDAPVGYLMDFCDNNLGECNQSILDLWGFSSLEKMREQIDKEKPTGPCRGRFC